MKYRTPSDLNQINKEFYFKFQATKNPPKIGKYKR